MDLPDVALAVGIVGLPNVGMPTLFQRADAQPGARGELPVRDVSVISVGADNDYGHPAPATVDALPY